MRVPVRALVGAFAASATLLAPSSPAFAADSSAPAPPPLVVDLCEQLTLDPCPPDLSAVTYTVVSQVAVARGCTKYYSDIAPGAVFRTDPTLGISYLLEYAGVAVQISCSVPSDLTAIAVSQPAGGTVANSKTSDERRCGVTTYCVASTSWGNNNVFGTPLCSYSTAKGLAGTTDTSLPYFPSWTNAGVMCFSGTI